MRQQKGQVVGQAFMFLLAIIVFSMVVLYGYRAISSIGETREEAILIEFKDSLTAYAKQVTLAYKDVKRVPLNVPNRFDEVCFVDISRLEGKDPQGDNRFGDLFDKSPLIHDSVLSGAEQNVFLIPQAELPIVVDNIEIPDMQSTPGGAWFCMTTSGGLIVLRMEGLGNKVQISPWVDYGRTTGAGLEVVGGADNPSEDTGNPEDTPSMDLAAVSISVNGHTTDGRTFSPGEELHIKAIVAPTGPVTTAHYNLFKIFKNGAEYTADPIPNYAPSETHTIGHTLEAELGEYRAQLYADSTDVILESNEDNNERQLTFSVV